MTADPLFDTDLLKADLVRDEGLRLKPYHDTEGHLTIGIGRNLDAVGISTREADFLYGNDVAVAVDALDTHIPWWTLMTEHRQRALVNMCFNMGWGAGTTHGLHTFTNTLELLRTGRYEQAADACLKSKWARQVGDRAVRIADLFRQG